MRATWLAHAALLTCGMLLTAACSAHNDGGAGASAVVAAPDTPGASSVPAPASSANFTAGDNYVSIEPPPEHATPTGPVRIVEVFSYGCPHCAHFAPYMDELRAELPRNVTVGYMPAIFSPAWVPFAQAYYAATELGVFKQTHDAVFKAMLEHYPLNSLEDLANFYARHGVDSKAFLAAATSPKTMQQMAADQKTQMTWGVNSTPMLVVGRLASDAADAPFVALMRSNNIDNYAQLQQLGLWMVKHAEPH